MVLRPGWAWRGLCLPLSDHQAGPGTSAPLPQPALNQLWGPEPPTPTGVLPALPAPAHCQPLPAAHQVATADLRAFCRQAGLSGYKLPGLIVATAATASVGLPVNSAGKVLKVLVRQQLLDLQQAQVKQAGSSGRGAGGPLVSKL